MGKRARRFGAGLVAAAGVAAVVYPETGWHCAGTARGCARRSSTPGTP
jgi:hypothetical protein